MRYSYTKTFALKNIKHRNSVNLISFRVFINRAVQIYNNKCKSSRNPKSISVTIYQDKLEFVINSTQPLQQKYVGIALRLFSQILVDRFGFLSFCTNANPRKLFVTV